MKHVAFSAMFVFIALCGGCGGNEQVGTADAGVVDVIVDTSVDARPPTPPRVGGQTGFECNCDEESAEALPVVEVGGSFVHDEEFAERARRPISDSARSMGGVNIGVIPVYYTDDEWVDVLVSYDGGIGLRVIPQIGPGVWGELVEIRNIAAPAGRCVATVDIVGDAAWDVVCLSPTLGVFEGQMTEGGQQRVSLSAESWRPLLADVPDGLRPEMMSRSGHMIRWRDYDRDGIAEAIVTTFDEAVEDYILHRQDDDTYVATPFRTGMTFATCDIDVDGDGILDWLFAFKEGGFNRPGNLNGMYSLPDLVPMDPPISAEHEDRTGWFGSSSGRNDHTPMGCAYVSWAGGYFLSQDAATSAIFRPTEEGVICDSYPCIQGWRARTQFPFYWGVSFTSWRGRRHEGVIAAAYNTGAAVAAIEFVAYDPQTGHVSVYNRGTGDERLDLAGLRPGNYYGLSTFDYSGDGWPDILASLDARGAVVDPLRLFGNELTRDAGEDILCINILGRGGESANVTFEFGDGQVERQLVANGGQIVSSPPPVVFRAVSGVTTVTIERPGRAPEVHVGVEPGGCYNALPVGEDGVLPPPVSLRR